METSFGGPCNPTSLRVSRRAFKLRTVWHSMGAYSAVAPESLTTFAHFTSSDCMNALNSAGEFERASTPCRSSCSFIDAVDNARTISRLMAATIGAGVWAGATIPHHEVALNPGAASAIAGRFGIDDDRVGLVTAIARRRFDLMCGTTARALAKLIAIWPPIRS